MFSGEARDGFCRLLDLLVLVETPYRSIVWTFVRHIASSCLTFPALHEVASLQFLPSGQYRLCFGYCFSGPLPLRSHNGQVPSPQSFSLYSEIGQIHLSIEAQCDHSDSGIGIGIRFQWFSGIVELEPALNWSLLAQNQNWIGIDFCHNCTSLDGNKGNQWMFQLKRFTFIQGSRTGFIGQVPISLIIL